MQLMRLMRQLCCVIWSAPRCSTGCEDSGAVSQYGGAQLLSRIRFGQYICEPGADAGRPVHLQRVSCESEHRHAVSGGAEARTRRQTIQH